MAICISIKLPPGKAILDTGVVISVAWMFFMFPTAWYGFAPPSRDPTKVWYARATVDRPDWTVALVEHRARRHLATR